MGKLNIAHHKSYHPYRQDNIERVRKDEEEAQLKEAQEEGRIMLADAEARIDLLRKRAGVDAGSSNSNDKKKTRRQEEREEQKLLEAKSRDYLNTTSSTAQLPTTNGHINFFQDIEQGELGSTLTATKKVTSVSTDKGIPLAPSEKDLKPWYSNRKNGVDEGEDSRDSRQKEGADEKRLRDTARKTVYDPLTSINHQLSSKSSDSTSQDRFKQPRLPPTSSSSGAKPSQPHSDKPPELQARLARESSERERALALIRRRKREMMGSETPSTVHGGVEERGYEDMFNRKEVEEARRERERRRERGAMHWDDGRDGRRERRPSWSSSGRW